MSIDVKSYTLDQLKKISAEIKKQQSRLAKRAPVAKVREKLAKMAEAEGYSLAELFGGKVGGAPKAAKKAGRKAAAKKGPGRPAKKAAKPAAKKAAKKATKKAASKRAGTKVPPKYSNPANPKETWTGRGRQPRWMAAQVKAGKKPEDFLIK